MDFMATSKKVSDKEGMCPMSPDVEIPIREVLRQLRKTDTALVGKHKNQPVIVFRHGRWHMLTIGFVVNARMKTRRGISCVHFMSPYRARKTIAEWLPYSKLVPFEEVCPAFRAELAAKVLPTGEEYRPLVSSGRVVMAGGYTTDTLQGVEGNADNQDQLVASIERMVQTGEMGPFLHFEGSYEEYHRT
jgi:hypothetical protein